MTENKVHFIVDPLYVNSKYDTYDEAVKAASRRTADRESEAFAVYQLVATVESPLPEAIVTKVTA